MAEAPDAEAEGTFVELLDRDGYGNTVSDVKELGKRIVEALSSNKPVLIKNCKGPETELRYDKESMLFLLGGIRKVEDTPLVWQGVLCYSILCFICSQGYHRPRTLCSMAPGRKF